MPEKAADRRTVRTKKLLRQALIELMREKGMDHITVSDLTARAEINRGTFYLHYRDVYDLVEQFQQEIIDGLKEIAAHMNIQDIAGYADKDEPYPGLVSIFEYWERHADFAGVMLGPKGDLSFIGRVKELMRERIYGKVLETLRLFGQDDRVPIPLDFVIAYTTSANFGFIQHWIETGRKQSPAEMARMMTRLISQGPLASAGIRPVD
ncbi:TetR/AcrR family transcriptional regulator [Cohnella massiliensis]|uniref:TetR/AcrR family transcriptional regulator n=1 Tax=Cohnella massiliensis TaxID=1816691 RepID=UPI0009BAD521|nr:TetR/AcrR family transcriptional regulator [Cohnella massiliensis]